jgi:signal transduction histidine kinase
MDVLHIIQKSAASTYDLLENLLAWANSQRNEIVYSPEEIKLNEVVLFSVDLFNELTQNKGITIINNIPNNTIVFADKNMLMIVLRNIISNAIKFTANGKQIIISTYSKGNQQIVKIQDEGTGILPENLLKLFKNTEHITTYGTIGEKGCGLGLLLCKDFIEKNSGEIWVESEIDKGSVFSFSLPIENTLLPE